MMKRMLAILSVSLLFVWPGGGGVGAPTPAFAATQTPPVINGQTGAVTVSPQTLEWLRQRLAEEEERLRQLQIAIQQVARAVAASQTTAQTLVPTPAEAAIPTAPVPATAEALVVDGTAPRSPVAAATPNTPLIPRGARRATTSAPGTRPSLGVMPHPPLIPSSPRRATSAAASRPPLIPAPLQREIPSPPVAPATAAVPTAPPVAPVPPVTIAPLPVTLTEPVAIVPPAEPAAPVTITPPPVGPPMPSVTISPPAGPVPVEAPANGAAVPPAPPRAPKILIPGFMPKGTPPAADGTNSGVDHSGSPVVIPPGSEGDDLVVPEGIVGANPSRQPSALPNADPLRAGQTMAQVRRIKGTPALISRDEGSGTETWTYPDGTLVFRAGRLSARQIANAEVPLMAPVTRRATAKAPPAELPGPTSAVKTPEPPRVAANPREVPSLGELLPAEVKPAPEKKGIVKKVAGLREKMRTTRGGRKMAASRRGKTITVRRSKRSIRSARAMKMRRWARAHRRAHRIALRHAAPRARIAALKACRKCRIARAYLRRTTRARVAAWRGESRARVLRADGRNRVRIIQRRSVARPR